MRISDWRSDVCSSDLVVGVFDADGEADDVGAGAGGFLLFLRELTMGRRGRVDDEASGVADIGEVAEELDRKSVGSGKSGAGRVDLGGRRILIKKKNTTLNICKTSLIIY